MFGCLIIKLEMEKDRKALRGIRILYHHFIAANLKQLEFD